MPSSTSNSEFTRPIPELPWTRVALVAALLVLVATVAWELRARSLGYAPTLNDTSDLWVQQRRTVQPDSVVIIGDSRALFDLDLDVLEQGLGKRPVQLSLVGTTPYPILKHFADDASFRGTLICSLLPAIYFAPPGSPPMENALAATRRLEHQTVAHLASHHLAMALEQRLAFLKQEDLALAALLKQLPVADRPGALVPPRLPPYFATIARDRQTRMIAAAETPGPLQTRIQQGWPPLFTPPPPPSFVPHDAFMAMVNAGLKARFEDTLAAVAKIRARGGKIVFVRFPVSGPLKDLEAKLTPRAQAYDPLVQASGVPSIHFEDFPELAGFTCPEWSHLSAADATEFSRRLVPHLKQALAP